MVSHCLLYHYYSVFMPSSYHSSECNEVLIGMLQSFSNASDNVCLWDISFRNKLWVSYLLSAHHNFCFITFDILP